VLRIKVLWRLHCCALAVLPTKRNLRLGVSNSDAFTLIALICSVLPFVERCMSHSDLEMAHDALAVGQGGPRGQSGLFYRMDADRVGRSMCDAT
jgi:hypothetical protein